MSRLLESLPGMRPGPDSDPDPDPVMDLPAFAPAPPSLPGPASPDPLSDLTVSSRADGADSTSKDTGTSIPGFFRQRSKSYAKIAGALLMAGGGWLNKLSGEEDSGAFIPDEEDQATIPPPLGRLAARRIKLGDPEQLSDLEDIGMAAVGVAVWLAKGVTAVLTARRDRRRFEKGIAVHQDQGDGQ